MKAVFGKHLSRFDPIKCRFGDLKPGDVFNYRDGLRVKIAPFLYRAVTSGDETSLEKVNSIRLGYSVPSRDGSSSVFSDNTIVDYYPDATLYLVG